MRDLAPPSLDKIQPYKPKSISESVVAEFNSSGGLHNLAANENPLGVSPKVLEILVNELPTKLHRYGISNQRTYVLFRCMISIQIGSTWEQVLKNFDPH